MFRLFAALSIGLLTVALVTGPGLTGDKVDKDKKEGKLAGMLPPGWKSLKLTADQKKKVYEIQKVYRAKIEAIEEQIVEMKAMEKAAMFKILDDDQKSLLRKLTTGEDGKLEKIKEDKKEK